MSPPSSFDKHRKHRKSYSQDMNDESFPTIHNYAALSASYSDSPFGPLDQSASRKAFSHLISILNTTHPDHDFSSLQPSDFRRESGPTTVINSFNNLLFGAGAQVPPTMWECLDRHINLKECAVYSHSPPESFLDDEPDTLWCYMWFFFNRRRKRVAYLHLNAIRHHYSHFSPPGDDDDTRMTNPNGEEEYDLTVSDDHQSDYDVVGDLELE